ncbi:putative signal transducing protein [Planctomycetota bacterium]
MSEDKLVIVAKYMTVFDPVSSQLKAQMLQLKLEEVGIKAFLENMESASMGLGMTAAVGGVQVCVNESDLEKASEIAESLEKKGPKRVIPSSKKWNRVSFAISICISTLIGLVTYVDRGNLLAVVFTCGAIHLLIWFFLYNFILSVFYDKQNKP